MDASQYPKPLEEQGNVCILLTALGNTMKNIDVATNGRFKQRNFSRGSTIFSKIPKHWVRNAKYFICFWINTSKS